MVGILIDFSTSNIFFFGFLFSFFIAINRKELFKNVRRVTHLKNNSIILKIIKTFGELGQT
ncbi:MAG: hypothetical protein DRO88_01425 [Promethearchaeia archaeon]|nr:MAG: hypothetical protein DRO88_01425 [Candidatus Lokiarchaeia archaeon]